MAGYATINPATGEVLAEFPTATDEAIQDVIARSYKEYQSYHKLPVEQRAAILRRAADLFRERTDELANLLVLEVGKPIEQARGEVQMADQIFRYYADHADELLADERIRAMDGVETIVRTQPLGPILAVEPWNFPYYQASRISAPNLLLGNTVILKHAHNCPQSALAVERVLHDAGLPKDAYINVFATSKQVADIVSDPRVQGVSLTGSEKAGSAVGEVAGRNLKRFVLELGGSDPFIVLEDADIDAAVQMGVMGRVMNGGQVCAASKRFIVVDKIYDEFMKKFTAAMTHIVPGDPTDPKTLVGPLSSKEAASDLHAIVQDAIDKGAKLESAPAAPADTAYYAPGVLTGVTPEMRAYREELFGPVAVVHRVPSPQAAVEMANDSSFGLGGAVFGRNLEEAQKVAEQVETGMVSINSFLSAGPEVPFGGIKRSGVGHELGKYGVTEFANKKLIRVAEAQPAQQPAQEPVAQPA